MKTTAATRLDPRYVDADDPTAALIISVNDVAWAGWRVAGEVNDEDYEAARYAVLDDLREQADPVDWDLGAADMSISIVPATDD